jgi:predicted pyridoxine 5'-phosphate oxidase superfamily flavin-nucleotide-binding protein
VTDFYHEGNRELQRRFDTTRVAALLEEHTLHDTITENDKQFMQACDMFFLATSDGEGNLNCSYKGGDPGFVRVIDNHTIAFPNYDGNGMYLSMGNLLKHPNIGILFISFEEQHRMRYNGVASIDEDDPLLAEYPGAQFIVRVRAKRIFPNCPRYIHKYQLVERSKYVPRDACDTPVPDWKMGIAQQAPDILPEGDPARTAANG